MYLSCKKCNFHILSGCVPYYSAPNVITDPLRANYQFHVNDIHMVRTCNIFKEVFSSGKMTALSLFNEGL